MERLQQTIAKSVTWVGVGIHSGKRATLTIKPGAPYTGIVFVRTDLVGHPVVNAHYKNVVNTVMATTLGSQSGKVTVGTVEHALAALRGLGVDNAVLEVDGPEVPILDGSSLPFCKSIESVGVVKQSAPRAELVLKRRIELKIAEKWAVAEPSAIFRVNASIDWDHPSIGYQEFQYIEGHTPFAELAGARTFGFMREVEALRRAGLARGGSFENAVVLDDALVLNPEGLRFPNEFVRHKVLDAIGDLALAGIPIRAAFRLHRAGHELHSQLLSAIFADPDNFEIIETQPNEQRRGARVRAALARAGFAATF